MTMLPAQEAVIWKHAGISYYVIGIEFSNSRPEKWYEVVIAKNGEGRRWVSCNCRGFTTAKRNRGKKQWERYCSHTEMYTLDDWPPLTPGEYRARTGEFPPSERIGRVTLDPEIEKAAMGSPHKDKTPLAPEPIPAPAPAPAKKNGRFAHLELEL